MKNVANLIAPLGLVFFGLTIINCQKDDFSSRCFKGIIPNDTIYRAMFNECFNEAIWIEVIGNDKIGKDVKIFTVSRGADPIPPIEYTNTIEVPLLSLLPEKSKIDTLLGRKVFFTCRPATKSEIKLVRNPACSEVYNTYQVPLMILTNVSFSKCPELSDK
jgi:hypothetical protein